MSPLIGASPGASEAPNERLRRLQIEAKLAAAAHVDELHDALVRVLALAGDVARGGEVYPPGVRQVGARCERFALASGQDLQLAGRRAAHG